MQGGTSIPMAEAEATMETACSGRYPPRLMAGISRDPMAETSATDAPEIPEKMYSPSTVEIPRLPRICPTRARAKVTRRVVIPPVFINSPTRIKSGTARRTNESIPPMTIMGKIKSCILPRARI